MLQTSMALMDKCVFFIVRHESGAESLDVLFTPDTANNAGDMKIKANILQVTANTEIWAEST